jgi:PTS system galactitol-specific IIC component
MHTIVNYITALGSTVVLPIIIFILGLIFGDRPGRALRSGLTVGVGFVGLGIVITLLLGAVGPATTALLQRTGAHLTAIDVGWPVAAAIAFGTTVGAIVVPMVFLWDVLLLATRLTQTLDVDIWNYWHYAFSGSLVYIITNSLWIGAAAALFHATLSFKIADLTAKRVQEHFGLPGISIPQGWAVTSVPLVLAVNWVIDRIPGLNRLEADPKAIQKKLGIIGEPLVMGVAIGIILGLAAGYPVDKILTLAITVGAVMLLMPRIIAILMEGLVPLSEAARKYMTGRFHGREFYIGLDSAIMIGEPVTVAAGLLLIPTVLFLAIVLPGNTTLPFLDLAALPFFVVFATPFTRGNLVRTFIIGAVTMVMILYIASDFAPLVTQTAHSIGYVLPASVSSATTITALSGGNLFAWLAVEAARVGAFGPVVLLVLALAFAAFFGWRKTSVPPAEIDKGEAPQPPQMKSAS